MEKKRCNPFFMFVCEVHCLVLTAFNVPLGGGGGGLYRRASFLHPLEERGEKFNVCEKCGNYKYFCTDYIYKQN